LADQVELIPLPMTVPHFRQPLLFYLHLGYRLIKDMVTVTWGLWKFRPDVLHITALYWRSIYREWYAVRLAKCMGIPAVYDIRAGTFTEFCQSSTGVHQWLIQDILRHSSQVAIQGRKSQRDVEARYGKAVAWIPNCFLTSDLQRYAPAPLQAPAEGEPLRLAYLGYVLPDKGIDTLLAVAEMLSARMPVMVTLIGEVAPESKALLASYAQRQQAAFQIRALGRLELAEVLGELQNQHLFVFLSRFFGEGHPNAVNEAMAMGLPIIASNNGFLEEVVTPECSIVFDNPIDPLSVAQAIAELTKDWSRLKAMGAAARCRIERVFSDTAVLPRMLELYRAAASSSKRPMKR
jgi:glycosyltransferase involved in cell wall biosynthesis